MTVFVLRTYNSIRILYFYTHMNNVNTYTTTATAVYYFIIL